MIRTIVVATSRNRAIGKDNDLLWHLPDDFKFFKETTKNHHILMGRKTYQSLGKPLPKRVSIVITRNTEFALPEGHHVVSSLEGALAVGEQAGLDEIMIIGGGKIYKESLDKDLVDKMYITEIDANIDGADTFFPEFDKSEWTEAERIHHPADERHQYAFDFVTYTNKKQNRSILDWREELAESNELLDFQEFVQTCSNSSETPQNWNADRFIAEYRDGYLTLSDDPYYDVIASLNMSLDSFKKHFSK